MRYEKSIHQINCELVECLRYKRDNVKHIKTYIAIYLSYIPHILEGFYQNGCVALKPVLLPKNVV